MNQDEKRQLENQLMVMGLAKLEDPQLIQQLAALVNHWRGDQRQFLIDMLNEVDAQKRYEAYQGIRPHLTFKNVPSFIDVEMSIAQKAGDMVSRKQMRQEGSAPKPVEVGGKKYIEVEQSRATGAMVKTVCQRCGRKDQFIAATPVQAMMLAREKGWKRFWDKEHCPKCTKTLEAGGKSSRVLENLNSPSKMVN